MVERWYRNGIMYSLDVSMFQDSDGDGVGDLPGLTSRLSYLSWLGVDIVWLNPLHPVRKVLACPPRASGRRSCATTTRWTCPP